MEREGDNGRPGETRETQEAVSGNVTTKQFQPPLLRKEVDLTHLLYHYVDVEMDQREGETRGYTCTLCLLEGNLLLCTR
jgi:hypothetical protein